MIDKLKNTERAHQEYSTPVVSVVALLIGPTGGLALFPSEQGNYELPHGFARAEEDAETSILRVLASWIRSDISVSAGEYTLLSTPQLRADVYQYTLVARVLASNTLVGNTVDYRWATRDSWSELPLTPEHRVLLEHVLTQPKLEDGLQVPMDPSRRDSSDPDRLAATNRVHAANQPMPLITADAVLMKFSDSGRFEGVVLERRPGHTDREPDKWAFPAGFVNAHETTSEALAFEVWEELGISLKNGQLLSHFELRTDPERDAKWSVWSQFTIGYTTSPPRPTSPEVSQVAVFLPDEVPPAEAIAFDHAIVLGRFRSVVDSYIRRANAAMRL